MQLDNIEQILQRKSTPLDNAKDLENLKSQDARILITGGEGSLGSLMFDKLSDYGIVAFQTDVADCDVTDRNSVSTKFNELKPTHVVHLAADKHAPEGETDPENTLDINVTGTMNVLNAAKQINAVVILSSTCKSCDPETVYGSTKLIAERIVLNQGGTVARFYNVADTSGNVFEIWDKHPENEPLLIMECTRYFMSAEEAVSLLIRTTNLANSKPGRYGFNPGLPQFVPNIAARLYPNANCKTVPPRRGDRLAEPLKANSERIELLEERFMRIHSPHDPI